MDTENLLGVGSRVRHSAYGEGVVIKLNYNTYDVCFMISEAKLHKPIHTGASNRFESSQIRFESSYIVQEKF